ncbi:hypothetical protein ACFQ05_21535 [Amycolatopsis umgeniensis]|uniref:Uncharacterized protein n=1 Tax=Amycolatopsis umgeniensis TaxID=336628 RepID=A0A841BI44_9PSEU|nr:hypothetical protein [Amycolatopsis umgeniensis]MBB5858202.1 hypothetical protein [Amycolatopsis umgeniensis]
MLIVVGPLHHHDRGMRPLRETPGLVPRLVDIADLAVFERHHTAPWESVAAADPSQVQLVMIGHDAAGNCESLIAWGKPMLLDTGYQAHPNDTAPSAPN